MTSNLLPNGILSCHIAGSICSEVTKMADTIIEEFIAWKVKSLYIVKLY